MTDLENHFKSAEAITYEALSIALEKAKVIIQEKDKEIESLKADLITIGMVVNSNDLTPPKKEPNGMDIFKTNPKC